MQTRTRAFLRKTGLILFLAGAACRWPAALPAPANGEWETVRQNYLAQFLGSPDGTGMESGLTACLEALPPETEISDQMVVELHQRYTPDPAAVDRLLEELTADGCWTDIDYADRKRSGWAPKTHADRILLLAKEYRRPGSAFYGSERVETTVRRAMRYWFDRKPVCPNWWYNRIGVPKTLGPAFLLLEDRLSKAEKEAAVRVMKQSDFGMTGQNKVWLAGNVFIRALLEHDPALLRAARDTIASEIVTGRPEGIRPDWSFHQHGPQQQFGNYGAAYLSGMAAWSTVFAGTSLAFSPEQLAVLRNFLMQGYARVLWKGYLDVNALGRQFFRRVQRHKALTVAFAAAALSRSDPAHADAYERLVRANFGPDLSETAAPGIYHFYCSDQTVYRAPHWMVSVKMSSERVIGGESGNGDNLQGYYLADGATYTYTTGDEYADIFPCWDWRKIPGITSYDTAEPLPELTWGSYRNGSRFVGNINDGASGLTVLDLDRDGLRARKAWIFTPEYVCCLGLVLESDSDCAVVTSVEQRLKKGELLMLDRGRWKPVKGRCERTVPAEGLRFFHDRTGYILWHPGNTPPARVVAACEPRTGHWRDVMQMYRPDTVRQEVTSLYWEHGQMPHDTPYAYLILPATGRKAVRRFPLNTIRILRNDRTAQAVSTGNGTDFFLAVYQPAKLRLTGRLLFEAETPGLYHLRKQGKKWKITGGDPTRQQTSLSFRLNGERCIVALPAGEEKEKPGGIFFEESR